MATTPAAGNLDEKLDELSIWIEANRDVSPADWEEDVWPEIKTRIKQAFKDAGWTPPMQFTTYTTSDLGFEPMIDKGGFPKQFADLTTGQEWYDRFETELSRMTQYPSIQLDLARGAAKKASGIQD